MRWFLKSFTIPVRNRASPENLVVSTALSGVSRVPKLHEKVLCGLIVPIKNPIARGKGFFAAGALMG